MPTINDRKKTYADRAESFGAEEEKYRKLVRNSNLARGATFLAGVVLAIVAVNFSMLAMWIIIAVATVAFLYFVKKNADYEALRNYNHTMKSINLTHRPMCPTLSGLLRRRRKMACSKVISVIMKET